jgi:hypothetical protein
MLMPSHRTQADAVAFRLPAFRAVAALGSGIPSQRAFPDLRLPTLPTLLSTSVGFRFSNTPPVYFQTGLPPHAGNEAPGPQVQNACRSAFLRRRTRGRKRQHPAQAGADVRHPKAARHAGSRHHRRRRRRSAARRFRTTCRAPTTSTSRPRKSAASACAPATPSKVTSARRRKASATSRCSRSIRSISRTPKRRAIRSTSTT